MTVLDDWQIDKAERNRQDHQLAYPARYRETPLELLVSSQDEAKPVRTYLNRAIKQKSRPPLLGLMHYKMCRLVVEPLSVFEKNGPKHLNISDDKIDRKALLQAIRFT